MRMRSNFVLAALMSLPAVTFAATPTMSSVTGTVQTGGMLTVTGSNLNAENKTNWDPFFVTNPNASSFEGSSSVADGYSVIGPPDGVYDTTVKLLGTKSMRFHVEGAAVDNQFSSNAFSQSQAQNLWTRTYVRYNLTGGWPTSHIKMIDIFDGGYYQPSNDINGQLPTSFFALYDASTRDGYYNIPRGQLENNRWYAYELHIDKINNLVEIWIDGTKVYTDTKTIADKTGMNAYLFGMVNECCTSAGFSLDNWFDGLAVASSRIYPSSVVEISNSATYGAGTKVYQAPLFISDGSVQIKADLTGLGAGPYYLWVTNNRQERSQAYVLGGSNSLAVPQKLTVQ